MKRDLFASLAAVLAVTASYTLGIVIGWGLR